jgi:O-antigen/teichoic acid export membrane protein
MIARKAVLVFLSKILVGFFGYVSLYFVARYMGPEPLGMVYFAIALVGLFRIFSDLGLGSAHIKRLSEGMDMGKCMGTYISAKLVLTIIMVLGLYLYIAISKYFLGVTYDENQLGVIAIILIGTIILELSYIMHNTFVATKEIGKAAFPLLVGRFIQMLSRIIVAIFGFGVFYLAGAQVLASIVIGTSFLFLFRKYPIGRPDWKVFKSYYNFALPVMFIGFLLTVNVNVDRIILEYYLGARYVGLYTVPQVMLQPILDIGPAVTLLLFPTISSLFKKGDAKKIHVVIRSAERYISMLLLPILIFLFFSSELIVLHMFGDEFLPSVNILRLGCISGFIYSISVPYTSQLMGSNRPGVIAIITFIVVMSNMLLNFIFIPEEVAGISVFGYGMIGAKLASLLSIIFGSVLARFFAWKYIGTRQNIRIFFHLFAGAAMGVFLYSLSFFSFGMVWWFFLLTSGLIAYIIFYSSLFLFREFSKKDFLFIIDKLNINKMYNYVHSEIKG